MAEETSASPHLQLLLNYSPPPPCLLLVDTPRRQEGTCGWDYRGDLGFSSSSVASELLVLPPPLCLLLVDTPRRSEGTCGWDGRGSPHFL